MCMCMCVGIYYVPMYVCKYVYVYMCVYLYNIHKGVRPVLSLLPTLFFLLFFFSIQYKLLTWRPSNNCFTSITIHNRVRLCSPDVDIVIIIVIVVIINIIAAVVIIIITHTQCTRGNNTTGCCGFIGWRKVTPNEL